MKLSDGLCELCVVGKLPNIPARVSSGFVLLVGSFLLPLMIIMFCYMQMLRAVRRVQTTPIGNFGNVGFARARRNLIRVVAIVTAAGIPRLHILHFCVRRCSRLTDNFP